MLKLTFGTWKNKSGNQSGSFNVLGKRFIAFLEKSESTNPNAPDYSITIMESKDAPQDRN